MQRSLEPDRTLPLSVRLLPRPLLDGPLSRRPSDKGRLHEAAHVVITVVAQVVKVILTGLRSA